MIELDEQLRSADPATGLPAYSAEETETLIARIRAASGADDALKTRRQRPTRWILLAAAVLTVALMIVPSLGIGPGREGATAAASGVLDRARLAAVDPPVHTDQYWKITVRRLANVALGHEGAWTSGDPNVAEWWRHAETVRWVPVDASRPTWTVERTGPYLWQLGGPPVEPPVADWTVTSVHGVKWVGPSAAPRAPEDIDIAALTDPVELRAALYDMVEMKFVQANAGPGGQTLSAPDHDVRVATEIVWLLGAGDLDRERQQVLFDVLKTVPGIDLIDGNASFDGRRAVTIGPTAAASYSPAEFAEFRTELAFDRDSGAYLGLRIVLPDGSVVDNPVTREIVDEVDAEVVASGTLETCTRDGDLTICRS